MTPQARNRLNCGHFLEEIRTMRCPFDPQLRLGSTAIEDVELDLNCRDEIVPILRALQYIYSKPELREKILELIAADVNAMTSSKLGRKGMTYWEILVLASVRLGCKLDYDKLHDLANNYRTLRIIMGVQGAWGDDDGDKDAAFSWRQIRENVIRIKPETIEKINQIVVAAGHELAPDAAKQVRGDSFVTETNIHHPSDSAQIGDGLRNVIKLCVAICSVLGTKGWREHAAWWRKVRKLKRKINNVASKKGTNHRQRLTDLYGELLDHAETLLTRAQGLQDHVLALIETGTSELELSALVVDLCYFISVTEHAGNLARRRVLEGEQVPADQKLFSVYEPDTELIVRGKTRTPVQFGHRILIIEDTIGFICHYEVVPRGVEERDIVVDRMRKLQDRLDGKIERASFDKGFHSPDNQRHLADIVAHPCIPSLGKSTASGAGTVEFRESRTRHPGVESTIGGLQSGNGLDRCRDHSRLGYDRYVGLGILGRNLHVLGKLLISLEAPSSPAAISKRKPAIKSRRKAS